MLDRESLLSQAKNAQDKLVLARVLDKVEETFKVHEPRTTDFLDPYQQQLIQGITHRVDRVSSFFSGGYPQAERKRLVCYPDYLAPEVVDPQLKYIKITGCFKFQEAAHRDYLGSILGLGIKREKLGDIILCSEGAQVIVDQRVADYILQNLHNVHQLTVRLEEISPDKLVLPEEKVKEIRATVASLRLDAVAGEGFGASRTQMAKEIAGEKVKLNWLVITNTAHDVKPGDVISIRGRGRVLVDKISGQTKKGRIGLVLKRFL